MAEALEPDDVRTRAIRGVASLFARQFVVRALGFAGMLVLARVLTPAIFGVFAIAQFVVLLFEQVSSLGLGAALLRRRNEVTAVELRTVFTVQQVFVGLSIVAIFASAPLIVAHYHLEAAHETLIRVMAFSLLLASLKTVPTILLERRLRHDLIAASEVTEYLVYQVVAVALALLGFGVWSLAVALLLRGVTGVVVLYCVSWWRPRFGIDWGELKSIVRFGLPLQVANLLGLANNAVAPVILGSTLGTAAVGYANFSRSIVDALIFQPVIILGRVQFPVFSRMQDERTRLAAALERNLYVGALVTFMLAALIVSQARPLVDELLTRKWEPALALLYVLAPAYLAHAVVQPLTQALKALGDARTPLIGVVLQVTAQVLAVLIFARTLGLLSYAIGTAVGIALYAGLTLHQAALKLRVAVWASVRVPFAAAIAAAATAMLINQVQGGLAGLALSSSAAVGLYLLLVALLSGRRLAAELVTAVSALFPGSTRAHTTADAVAGALRRTR
jgi:O-antigen/teichoic acid export membrane protein